MDSHYPSEVKPRPRGNYKPVTVRGWMGTVALSCIPVVNIVMWFVWTFSAKKPSRKNYARAMLLLCLIFIVLLAVAVLCFGEVIVEWIQSLDANLFLQSSPIE